MKPKDKFILDACCGGRERGASPIGRRGREGEQRGEQEDQDHEDQNRESSGGRRGQITEPIPCPESDAPYANRHTHLFGRRRHA